MHQEPLHEGVLHEESPPVLVQGEVMREEVMREDPPARCTRNPLHEEPLRQGVLGQDMAGTRHPGGDNEMGTTDTAMATGGDGSAGAGGGASSSRRRPSGGSWAPK